MTYRFKALLCFCGGASLLSVACGGAFSTDDGGSASGGTTSGGIASGGGSATGGASVGGSGAGGAGTGGSVISSDCEVTSDCAAVLDASAPCFSLGCSLPVAASLTDVAENRCLMLWEERDQPAPSGCASTEPVACPEICAPAPSCAIPVCDGGKCQLNIGYTETDCSEKPDDCTTLNEKRQTTLDAARACNPNVDNIQCNATENVADECGCPLVVNEASPELVQAAKNARSVWAAQCPPPPCPYALCATPVSGSCGSDGVCASK